MRWFRELLSPALKCERRGHDQFATQYESGLRKATWDERYQGVVMHFERKRTICQRCGAPQENWIETMRRGIDSWSAPASLMDTFDQKGIYIERQWEVILRRPSHEGRNVLPW
jgi:hypothetical protein